MNEEHDAVNERHRSRMRRKKEIVDRHIAAANIDRGVLIVNCGYGKGKSSSGFGMVARALGHGMKAAVVQFIKGPRHTGEEAFFRRFPEQVQFHVMGEGFTWETQDRDMRKARDAWEISRALLHQAAGEADVLLVEGVMGLYDGNPSSADLARRFGIPVAAVIDARAMAQTFGALAQGLAHYGDVPFAGVIANRVAGEGHVAMLRESLAPDIPLLASLGADAERDHHNIKSGDHAHLQGGLIEDADPAHTQTLGPGGQPQILHGADAAIQVHGLHVGASDHHRAGALAVQFLLSLRRHQPWEINSNCSKPKP